MRIVITCLVLFIAISDSVSQTFTFSDTKFTVGSIMRCYTIRFELSKATLQPQGLSTLDSLADFMNKNTALVIEIGVHSDSRGSDISNTNLTQARAKAIRNYLIDKNVAESRLKAVGYGETKLLVKDEQINNLKTIEEKEKKHQLNRRVEFKIIAIH